MIRQLLEKRGIVLAGALGLIILGSLFSGRFRGASASNTTAASPIPTWILLAGGAAGCIWVLRCRRSRTGAQRSVRLKVVERIRLEPRQSLHLVEVEGRRWLLACSERGVRVLGRPSRRRPS